MGRAHRLASKGLQALYDRYVADDPEMMAEYERSAADADVAQKIYDLRTGAGLTQKQLADLVGTTASVISRLEDADYEGHSLTMLRRVAGALDRRVEIRFVPSGPATGVGKTKAKPRRAAKASKPAKPKRTVKLARKAQNQKKRKTARSRPPAKI